MLYNNFICNSHLLDGWGKPRFGNDTSKYKAEVNITSFVSFDIFRIRLVRDLQGINLTNNLIIKAATSTFMKIRDLVCAQVSITLHNPHSNHQDLFYFHSTNPAKQTYSAHWISPAKPTAQSLDKHMSTKGSKYPIAKLKHPCSYESKINVESKQTIATKCLANRTRTDGPHSLILTLSLFTQGQNLC